MSEMPHPTERADVVADVSDALFIAGYQTAPHDERDTLLQNITLLGELLLGSGRPWRIRRLAAPGSERDVPTRRNVRRELDALFSRSSGARIVLIVGEVTRTLEGLGLVCAPELGGFREDATVPLEWIGDRLRATHVATVAVLAAHAAQRDPQRWLTALASSAADHLVVAYGGDPIDAVSALREGLAVNGAAIASPRSVGAHLEHRLAGAAFRFSTSSVILTGLRAEPHRPIAEQHVVVRDDLVGASLPGRFRIEAELGRGSFAIVYRAHQELVGRDVAIKVLKDHVSPEAATLFLSETRTVARLDHRNIVRVFHADMTPGGRMFVAMELLSGRTVQQVIDEAGALPRTRVIAIASQLIAALATAHAGGVIHADVKPSNLFVQDGEPQRVVLLDFGLSQLRAATAVASRGGTPAYMAPEQLRDGQIDASSDLYAAGLVIVTMLAGQRPGSPAGLAAAIDAIDDSSLRAVVQRALAERPSDRFASAGEMATALTGEALATTRPPRPPFRPAPFTENDHADFFGREREIELLLEHVLFRRAMVYVAPSGTGKTSLLLAGLLPRLARLAVRGVYVACRPGLPHGVAAAIAPTATSVTDALTRSAVDGRRLVIVIDQIESALHTTSQQDTVVEDLGLARWPHDAQVSVVLSVREEYLARLLDRTQRIEPGIPVVRLGPLTPDTARDVLGRTLGARGLTIEPALLDELMPDLERAAARLAVELSWGNGAAVYPPHLQLAGAVLYEALPAGTSEIPCALYRELGGLDKIISEHLHHVLEGELSAQQTAIARDVLLALVTSSHTRTVRAETELITIARRPSRSARGPHGELRPADAIHAVLTFLRDRGLLVSTAGPPPDRDPLWDLAHDSLVPQIEAWITRTDLARLRALELVRYHLRRSDARSPSLLAVDELREVAAHLGPGDLGDLDDDWARSDDPALPATRLLARSRRAIHRRRVSLAAMIAGTLAVAGWFGWQWQDERASRQRETRLRDRDIGHFVLDLTAFDWDTTTLTAAPIATGGTLALDWELRKPDDDDEDSPGAPLVEGDLARRPLSPTGTLRSDDVAARGGAAVLVVHRRDPAVSAEFCSDVLITVRRLPGYAAAGAPVPHIAVRVPSCAATRADLIEIPAGPFIAGGQGEPPTPYRDDELPREAIVDLPRYWIDRTEVTLAAMHIFGALRPLHGIAEPAHPADHARYPIDPPYPVTAINWREARAVCRFFGKDLPTLDQWDKALRGGTTVNGAPNPCPRRNFAWCGAMRPGWANVRAGDQAQQRPVATNVHDVSPYGVTDLVGNVQEWTRSPDLPYAEFPVDLAPAERYRRQTSPGAMMITRGCNWGDLECASLPLTIMPIPNARLRDFRYFTFGARCALSLERAQLERRR